jgi:hypothetical protein
MRIDRKLSDHVKVMEHAEKRPTWPESAAGDKNGQESKGGKKKLSLVLAGIVSSLFLPKFRRWPLSSLLD